MQTHTPLLIIGAGPFGLATAAHAKQLGIEHRVVGVPMDFWNQHMPAGMYLRSGVDWHLDTGGRLTINEFLHGRGLDESAARPFPLQLYLAYTNWFQQEAGLDVTRAAVTRLARADDGRRFVADLNNGEVITADRVVVAVGFRDFANAPADLVARLPAGRFEHTCTAVNLRALEGKRVLIVGGRQSAFEWAALLVEAGAAAVHLTYRHDTPRFAESYWTWAGELVERFVHEPGWYRRLSQQQRDALGHRLWTEGRLKLEPWLEPRIRNDRVALWPRTQIASTRVAADGTIDVTLDSGDEIQVDRIILATGYKPAIDNLRFLAAGNLLPEIQTASGAPVLDDTMQSSVPGLFFTSLLATADFGPFFAFTVSARASARLIGTALRHRSAAQGA